MLRKLVFISLLGVAASSLAAVPVHVVSVVEKKLPEVLHSTGTILGTLTSYIQTEVAGKVDALPLRPGDSVKKGQIVADIDPTLSAATLVQAKAQQARLAAMIAGQEIVVKRTRSLYKGEAATKTKLQAEVIKLKSMLAEKAAVDADVAKANYGHELTTIRAQSSGIIQKVEVRQGSVVDAGHKLYLFTNTDKLKAILPFSQKYRASVKPGLAVTLRSSADGVKVINTVISHVKPMANPQSRSFEAVAYFNNSGHWHPGGSVFATITLKASRPVFIVPYQSIVIKNKRPAVFVIKGNKAQLRNVKLGPYYQSQSIQLLSGVTQGEKVVSEGASYLVDGDTVAVTR